MKAFREPFRLKPPEVNSRPGGQGGVVAVAEPDADELVEPDDPNDDADIDQDE